MERQDVVNKIIERIATGQFTENDECAIVINDTNNTVIIKLIKHPSPDDHCEEDITKVAFFDKEKREYTLDMFTYHEGCRIKKAFKENEARVKLIDDTFERFIV